MTGRPEILWPLFADLQSLPGVGPQSAKLFPNLDIQTPKDLIFTLPHSVIDRRPAERIADLPEGSTATIAVRVERHHPPRTKGRPWRVDVSDGDSAFQLVFFHGRGEYLKKQLPEGEARVISGKVETFDGVRQIVHPDYILRPGEEDQLPEFEPVYPLTQGISQKLMAKAIDASMALAPDPPEWADGALVASRNWPGWNEALQAAHNPSSMAVISPASPAHERLAYDEFLAHQLTLALARKERRRSKGRVTKGTGARQSKALAALPYQLTGAQERAAREIAEDMGGPARMNRLLQGDVGAGKTVVALLSLLVAVEAGGQGVLMAPTEILARQHLSGLKPFAEAAGVVIEILTGRDKGKERQAKLAALAAGSIHVLVGTHAVFQDDVVFHDLRLAIIDEQHRFGVAQRMALGAKGDSVDVLVMTATPIPRSLNLTQYGDMDVSILDEKPPGRSPVTTALISMSRMDEVIEHLRGALEEGRQAYWVCPLVEESETVDLTAAEDRFKALRAAFGDSLVGLVHGQMPHADRDAGMARFVSGETQVLVATTVIEVGVDVPNASIMVIERAENFGLAQLHQLRGRVGRGAAESTCLLMFQTPLSEGGRKRLEILRETEDGFRIAEEDLVMRGAGDVLGTAQSGLPRFRIGDLESQAALMAVARDDARRLIETDPSLTSERGIAARTLLWLHEKDKAIRMISVG
ncbi:MAG: ATP-dependent DNA helicase RecG [Paracoccaceae bacterium]|nr:ATP-dependent DNA helicase RecG [Paracoccaceae bacterium]